MDLPELLAPDRISCNVTVQSKKRALQTLAELLGASLRQHLDTAPPESPANGEKNISAPGKSRDRDKLRDRDNKDETQRDCLSDMDILDALTSRERLGSTGLGHGVALPHSRVASIEAPLAAMITLNEGVEFDSIDDQSVDLMLGLLVPEECNDEHLRILAKLAQRFSDESLRADLRNFDNPAAMFEHIATLPPLE